jgi:hypothetical protein
MDSVPGFFLVQAPFPIGPDSMSGDILCAVGLLNTYIGGTGPWIPVSVLASKLGANPRTVRRWVNANIASDQQTRVAAPSGGAPVLYVTESAARDIRSKFQQDGQQSGPMSGPKRNLLKLNPIVVQPVRESELVAQDDSGARERIQDLERENSLLKKKLMNLGREFEHAVERNSELQGTAQELEQSRLSMEDLQREAREWEELAKFNYRGGEAWRLRVGELEDEVDSLREERDRLRDQLVEVQQQVWSLRLRITASREAFWRWWMLLQSLSWWKRRRLPHPPVNLYKERYSSLAEGWMDEDSPIS